MAIASGISNYLDRFGDIVAVAARDALFEMADRIANNFSDLPPQKRFRDAWYPGRGSNVGRCVNAPERQLAVAESRNWVQAITWRPVFR